MRWNRRIAIWSIVIVVVLACIAGGIAIWALGGGKPRVSPRCRVDVGSSHYAMDLDQAANATTIAAVGKQLGLPDHAVTVALATALQESNLHNLSYGDRDSLGLFQQRPSQGWGTRAQILDPRTSSAAFFRALARVPGWQTMTVTDAAQAVQHSNASQAYAVWAPMARTIAIAATGEVPAGLACQFAVSRSQLPPASPEHALTEAFGPLTLNVPVASARGWTIASWLVGHAQEYRITSVRYAGRQWTPDGTWNAFRTTDTGVGITQATPT
jgi:hypothetical protein